MESCLVSLKETKEIKESFRPLAGNRVGKNGSVNSFTSLLVVSVPLRGIGLESVELVVFRDWSIVWWFRSPCGE